MKVGRVIGRAVLSDHIPEYKGSRWLIVSPCSKSELSGKQTSAVSALPSLIVYDDLGATDGDLIGYTEGGEATLPFDRDMPIDAYNCCIFDQVTVAPEFQNVS
jgi:ethanolamine utilization protein EutN